MHGAGWLLLFVTLGARPVAWTVCESIRSNPCKPGRHHFGKVAVAHFVPEPSFRTMLGGRHPYAVWPR